MKIFDITRSLLEAPVYPGDQAAEIRPVEGLNGYRCSVVTASSHSGTHADACSHFLENGRTMDEMPLENYCGSSRVLTVGDSALVTVDDLRGRLGGKKRIVLRCGAASLCEEAAEYLVSCEVKLVVTDGLSIAPKDNEAAVHRILMEGGTAIVENAVLDGVPDGDYLIFAFPAKYSGCDGAPVRAVLMNDENEDANLL